MRDSVLVDTRPIDCDFLRQMWIKCTNDGTASIKLPWVDGPVSFSEAGTAQVPAEVGERLVEEIDAIEPTETNT